MIQDPSLLLLNKQKKLVGGNILNRHNVKYFLRILVGLALAHIIGHQFRSSDAAPNNKSSWKHRLQKTTLADGMLTRHENRKIIFISHGYCGFRFLLKKNMM